MEPFISNDSFDAFRTDNGIEIREKKAAAKKFSVVILVVGISFIPMEGLTYDWITTMFNAVFLYGGILMLVLGLLVLILKGMGNNQGPVTTIDRRSKTMTLRKKE